MVLVAHTSRRSFLSELLAAWGVELFFALSGFLIGTILIRQVLAKGFDFSGLVNFWMRRWWRTLPSYYFWLTVFVLITLVAKNLTLSKTEIIRCLFFVQNLAWAPPKHFGISWSLTIEEWFYLLYPLFILFFIRFFSVKKTFVVATAIFIIVPILTRLGFRVEGGIDEGMRKVVCFRLDAIMYGVCAALTHEFLPQLWAKRWQMALLGACSLGGCGWYIYLRQHHSGSELIERNILLPAISFSFALMFSWFTQVREAALPTWVVKPLVATSLISYSLYLCHIPCIILVGFAAKKIGGEGVDVMSWRVVSVVWVLSFTVAALAYRFIEKTFLTWRDAHYPSVRVTA